MKVLHVINTLSAGGAELHLLALCRYLRGLGIQVEVACLREHVAGSRSLRPDFLSLGVPVHHLGAEGRWEWRFPLRLRRLLWLVKPDVLHTHLPRADLAGVLTRGAATGPAWVASVHAIYSETWAGKRLLPLLDRLWRRADGVIAISHAVKEWLVRRGLPPDLVRVIHYGIETARFAQARLDAVAELRARAGVADRYLIGAAGRLEPKKGHDVLMRALASPRLRGKACLAIAGHDPWGYGERLAALVRELGLEDSIRLLGFVDDVPSFYHALDVFAFASTSEGFGQVVIEAMAAGKPVVASRLPPLTEIVEDGVTGCLARPDDPESFAEAIARILADPERAGRMGEAARERVAGLFSAERMAQETAAYYEEILARRRAGKGGATPCRDRSSQAGQGS